MAHIRLLEPDDAIHRGYDKQAERDLSSPGTFISNFQPLTRADAIAMRDDANHQLRERQGPRRRHAAVLRQTSPRRPRIVSENAT